MKITRLAIAALIIGSHTTTVFAEDLLQTYQQASSSDPILRAEQAAYEAATYGKRQAVANYRPSISLSASNTNTDEEIISSNNAFVSLGERSYTTKGYSLTLRQALYRYDYISQLKQAKATTRQAEAKLNDTLQTLILRVAKGYFDALAAQNNLEFAQAEKNAIARQLEQTQQRFEVGLIAITDVHEAQAAFDLATASEIVAQNTLAISHQALREITGQLPDNLHPLGENMSLVSPEPADIEQWVNNALAQNFKVIAAEAAVESANQGLNQRRAGHHPTLDLVASRDHTDSGGTFGSKSENTSLSVQLNVPLYQGGKTSASIKEGIAQKTQIKEALEQQRRAIQRETSDAYLSVLAGISRVKALKQAVKSSASALEATQAGYDVGTRTTVDVLNVRRELFRAQRDYARARYDYILASLRLKQAAGILSDDDLTQINTWLSPAS